jgi:hypothetical protein
MTVTIKVTSTEEGIKGLLIWINMLNRNLGYKNDQCIVEEITGTEMERNVRAMINEAMEKHRMGKGKRVQS